MPCAGNHNALRHLVDWVDQEHNRHWMKEASNMMACHFRIETKGAFFWDYSIDSYSGIRTTEHTEYQLPKEQTLCYSENRIADVTKIKAMIHIVIPIPCLPDQYCNSPHYTTEFQFEEK